MGDHVVDAGSPFGASKSVNGNGATHATGYSVVSAGSLDEAAEHARTKPATWIRRKHYDPSSLNPSEADHA
jgi:hypothetical protein